MGTMTTSGHDPQIWASEEQSPLEDIIKSLGMVGRGEWTAVRQDAREFNTVCRHFVPSTLRPFNQTLLQDRATAVTASIPTPTKPVHKALAACSTVWMQHDASLKVTVQHS